MEAQNQAPMATLNQQFRPAMVMLLLLTLLTGVLYPAAITGFAQVFFPHKATGSLIALNGNPVGSALIGQEFTDPAYFWGRISATGYNAAASSGTNYGATNPALIEMVQTRINQLKAADPDNDAPIPVDLVTASGSGLDPHISIAAAEYQMNRVAAARDVDTTEIRKLVQAHTEDRFLSFLGEPRVNVLELNLALDERFGAP